MRQPKPCSRKSAANVVYKVLLAEAVTTDLVRIYDHLIETYIELGDDLREAVDRVAERVRGIENHITRLAAAPYQGTLCPEIMPDLRRVTKGRAILYFVVNEGELELRILAVFFSGQDHLRHIVARLVKAS